MNVDPRAQKFALECKRVSEQVDPPLLAAFRDKIQRGSITLSKFAEPQHFTASAFVVDQQHESIALVFHRKAQLWLQAGGHIEIDDDSFEAAARREVREELGLEALERIGHGPAMLNRHPLNSNFGFCEAHWDVQFLFATPFSAADTPLVCSDESAEVAWFKLTDLPADVPADLPETLGKLGLR